MLNFLAQQVPMIFSLTFKKDILFNFNLSSFNLEKSHFGITNSFWKVNCRNWVIKIKKYVDKSGLRTRNDVIKMSSIYKKNNRLRSFVKKWKKSVEQFLRNYSHVHVHGQNFTDKNYNKKKLDAIFLRATSSVFFFQVITISFNLESLWQFRR